MVRKISVRGPALCRMWTGWSWGTKELVMLWMKTVIGPGPFFRWCFWGPNLRGLTFSTRHIQNWTSFLLWRTCFILSGALSNYPPLFLTSKLDTFWPEGAHCPVSYLIACLYCSWVFPGKNTGVDSHFPLQWTTFSQNSPLWPIHLGGIAWHGSQLHWDMHALLPWQDCDPWRESKFWCYKELPCIGTWNVRPMHQDKFDGVKQEMARLNISILESVNIFSPF